MDKRTKLPQDATNAGLLLFAGLATIFVMPDVSATIKWELAGGFVLGWTVFVVWRFGWDSIAPHLSNIIKLGLQIFLAVLLVFAAYLIANIGYVTWQWVTINGILIVTWLNLIDLLFFGISILFFRQA